MSRLITDMVLKNHFYNLLLSGNYIKQRKIKAGLSIWLGSGSMSQNITDTETRSMAPTSSERRWDWESLWPYVSDASRSTDPSTDSFQIGRALFAYLVITCVQSTFSTIYFVHTNLHDVNQII